MGENTPRSSGHPRVSAKCDRWDFPGIQKALELSFQFFRSLKLWVANGEIEFENGVGSVLDIDSPGHECRALVSHDESVQCQNDGFEKVEAKSFRLLASGFFFFLSWCVCAECIHTCRVASLKSWTKTMSAFKLNKPLTTARLKLVLKATAFHSTRRFMLQLFCPLSLIAL